MFYLYVFYCKLYEVVYFRLFFIEIFDIISFLETFVRLRLAERAGDQALVKEVAAEWRRKGERMRKETRMMDHVREQGAPNLALYTNGLTALQSEKYFNSYFHLDGGADMAGNYKEETK